MQANTLPQSVAQPKGSIRLIEFQLSIQIYSKGTVGNSSPSWQCKRVKWLMGQGALPVTGTCYFHSLTARLPVLSGGATVVGLAERPSGLRASKTITTLLLSVNPIALSLQAIRLLCRGGQGKPCSEAVSLRGSGVSSIELAVSLFLPLQSRGNFLLLLPPCHRFCFHLFT